MIDRAQRVWRSRPDRIFFPLIAVTAGVFVVVGFAPTYFFKAFTDAPELRPILHWHGLLFSAWLALLLVQTLLIRSGRLSVHRQLGLAGTGLAVLMLVVGGIVSIQRVASAPDTELLLAITFGDLLLFAVFVGLAVHHRSRSAAHKRLMLLATASILPAGTARWPFISAIFLEDPVSTIGCILMWGMADLIIVAGVIYDLSIRGRVHPALLWGGLAIVVSQGLRLMIYDTAPWRSLAEFVRLLA